jgi:hypothetical protein
MGGGEKGTAAPGDRMRLLVITPPKEGVRKMQWSDYSTPNFECNAAQNIVYNL